MHCKNGMDAKKLQKCNKRIGYDAQKAGRHAAVAMAQLCNGTGNVRGMPYIAPEADGINT